MISSHRFLSLACLGITLSLACSPSTTDPDIKNDPTTTGPDEMKDGEIDTTDIIPKPGDDDVFVMTQPPTVNCGDGILDDDEACDDANMNNDDGCGGNCRYVEQGWVCPEPGQPCRAFAKCGDGISTFPEQCDDANLTNGDGCSEFCKFEIGFKCTADSPSVCSPAECGNGGEPEGAETCDDGNGLPFDGCSASCQGEPVCTEAGCVSSCGDGIKIGAEECDDGNGISGDGCSADCLVEDGYECKEAPACPDGEADCPLNLPIIFRDFPVSHSDFHAPDPPGTDNRPCDGFAGGMVAPTLDANGKPVFATAPASACVSNFNDWYNETDASSTILGSVTLYPKGNATYVNRFGENGEPYLTAVETPTERTVNGTCMAGCTQIVQSGLQCNNVCQPETQDAQQTCNRITQLEETVARYERELEQATADEDEARITMVTASLEAAEEDLADGEVACTAAQEASDACDTACQADFDAEVAECVAGCAPCSFDPSQTCTGGELLELDGDPAFFPIDGHPDAISTEEYGARIPAQIYMGLGWPWEDGACGLDDTCNTTLTHNFHFTSEIAYWFEYQEGMEADLTFVGDDDVWVFVNRKLVIDLGGIHVPLGGQFTLGAGGAITTRTWQADDPGVDGPDDPAGPIANGTTTAAELGLVPGNVYEIKVFHAERKPEGSSFQLTLSGFNASRSVCIPECGDGILASGEQCDNGAENTEEPTYNGCTTECRLGTYCGDGIVQEEEGEKCDDADPNSPDDCAGCRVIGVIK